MVILALFRRGTLTGSMTLFGGGTDCEQRVRRVGHSSPDLSEG